MELLWYTVWYFFVGTLLQMFVDPWARTFLNAEAYRMSKVAIAFVAVFLWPLLFIFLLISYIRTKFKESKSDTQSKNP